MFGLISNQLIYRQKRWLKQAFSLIQMMIILMVLVVHFILKVELDGKIVMIHRKKRRNNKVEHAKRKDICYFARLDKDEKEWTVEDFLRLLAQRKASMMSLIALKAIDGVKDAMENVKKRIDVLAENKRPKKYLAGSDLIPNNPFFRYL
uniref:Uncharacterized protein n=1 Tax=Wuchereria bancrofti TaxID=6293 RepID=A0AAF5Q628_WUCBA